MTVHAMMLARNEMGRYLSKACLSAQAVARVGGGKFIFTDDHSDDLTYKIGEKYADEVQYNSVPLFWTHEGRARQRHLDFAAKFVQPGEWILSLDADETISDARRLVEIAEAAPVDHVAIGIPLYEFWTPTQYRVDGQWFGTMSSRLFRYREGARITDLPMGSGSEPEYVQDAVARGRWTKQTEVHLQHWGYLDPRDRERKYLLYTSRSGGHGHSNFHVNSIIGQPRLRAYPGASQCPTSN